MISLGGIEKNSILQHDASDCGPACLASVINSLGGSTTVEKIRKLSGTEQTGTSMLGLLQAAKKCGLDATGYEASIQEIMEYKNILILHVLQQNSLEHYIVCFGFDDRFFIIWDPATGLKLMAPQELDEIWESRKCLGLIPNEYFRPEKINRSEKRRWTLNIIRPDIKILMISIFLGVLISGLGLIMAIFTQKLIDTILPSKDMKLLIVSLILVFILLAARVVFSSIRQLLLLNQGRLFNIRIIDDFFGSLLFLSKSFFDTRKTGDFVGRLNDTIRIQRVITEVATAYIIDILIVIVSFVLLFIYSTYAAIITLISLPVIFLVVYRWNKRIISAQHDVMASYAQSESNYIDSIRGITEIKAYKWQDIFRQKNRTVYSEFQDKSFFLGKIRVRLGLLTGIAATVYLVIILFYTSYAVISGMMSQGTLMAILTLSSGILPSLLNIALVAIPLSEVKVAMSRMFEFTLMCPEEKFEFDNNILSGFTRLELRNASFRFAGRRLLLKNINIDLESGKIISLVGESGSGKTTISGILLRFYDPENGSLRVNGDIDSESISIDKWRSEVGIIPQEIHIFNGTILQNIITEYSEDNIKKLFSMIEEYGLGPFLNSFPAGIMTMVGEEGLNLSGGQKQIISFLRAIFHNPSFLIIDEGTSNLDTETERLIMKAIMKLKSKSGILLISHKINLVKKISDEILVLEEGEITGKGSHQELIETNSLYRKLWDNYG